MKMKSVLSFLLLALLVPAGSLYAKKAAKKAPDFPKMGEYKSDYSPEISPQMPVIRINSESGKNEFVTTPISDTVKKHKLTWGEVDNRPDPWYERCTVSVSDGSGALSLDNAAAGVKVRGNYTTTYDKKPIRIKFDQKQAMLGLNGGRQFKNWVLLALYKDWSLFRDATALYISKMLSPCYSSDFKFVEVYINSEYWGVYLLAEQQEVREDRIGVAAPDNDYKGTDIGYFIEFDGYAPFEEDNFTINYLGDIKDIKGRKISQLLVDSYTIKSDITDPAQKAFISSYMNNLWKLCYEAVYRKTYYEFNGDFTSISKNKEIKSSYECVSKYIDIESLVNAYILCEITCDPDLFWSSFFMDIDFSESGQKKLVFEAPWDFDSALGNKNFCADSKGIYAGALSWDVNHEVMGTGNPWMFIFINCDWFQDMVRQKWASVRAQGIAGKADAFIESACAAYSENFARNQEKWKNIGARNDASGELCKVAAA
ncbi:MAG: CotH kinase family protein, partial [Treponema sp.]|nr:CotH kinase family protein [Treponema sp.]